MTRVTVRSSNIASIGYDEERELLEVEFIGGGVYQYSDVPKSVYDSFLNAASKGVYFHRFIKGNYDYTRVS